MTKEELATKLNGREYGSEITEDEARAAKAAGLLVIYGASDDLAELTGAFFDEASVYDGGEFYLHRGGLLSHHNDSCECEFCGYDERRKKCAVISAVWDRGGYSWQYETTVPHATFKIVRDGDKYCRGIVIDVKDLPTL